MIRICPFKEKERGEGRSQLGGQWKEKEKVPMFGGQWKEKEKLLFTSFHFPLNKFSFFLLILNFYFSMVLGHYLHISSLFLDL
jgi:hypothetical protein